MKPLPKKSSRRSILTKNRIILAASKHFTRHGFAGATVRDIAIDADCAIGLIRYHFGSKEDLYRAIAIEGSAHFSEIAAQSLAQHYKVSHQEDMITAWLMAPIVSWGEDFPITGQQFLCFLKRISHEAPSFVKSIIPSSFKESVQHFKAAIRHYYTRIQDKDFDWCLHTLCSEYLQLIAKEEYSLWQLQIPKDMQKCIRRLVQDSIRMINHYDFYAQEHAKPQP